MRPLPKARRDKPETLRQARTWGTVLNRYVALGVCHTCASHLAWGHQLGFTCVERQPCTSCLPVLATFPRPAANGWRHTPEGLLPPPPEASIPGPRRGQDDDVTTVTITGVAR